MNQETIEKLGKIGVFLHRGGLYWDSVANFFSKTPFVTLYEDSEEPTPEEIERLKGVVKTLMDKINPAAKDFTGEGINTVTLLKTGGRWTFRRLTWRVGPTWYPNSGTLEAVAEKL